MYLKSVSTSTASSFLRRCYGSVCGLLLVAAVLGIISACVPRPRPEVPPAKRVIREMPAGAHLVASGVLKGDMISRKDVVGDLRITKIASGQMLIAFEGYRMPDKTGGPQYQLKAVACQTGDMVVPVVSVESYSAEGITLRVTDPAGKMPLPLKYLVEHEFTIEVVEVPQQ